MVFPISSISEIHMLEINVTACLVRTSEISTSKCNSARFIAFERDFKEFWSSDILLPHLSKSSAKL